MESIETLNFYIGGFFGGYERIVWQNDKIHHQFFERSFYDEAVKIAKETALSTKTDIASKEGKHLGPVVSKLQFDKIQALIQAGIEENATLVTGGTGKPDGLETGYFIKPTIFADVNNQMTVARTEIFGPVLSTVRTENYEEAIKLVNENPYGNGVAIFTRDGDAARDCVNRIQVGMVGINVPIPVPVGYHSFGGWKQSLYGSHHIYGPDTIHFYTRLKAITSRWPTGIKSGAQFNFPTMS